MPNFTTEILWLTLIPGTVSGIPPIVPVSVPPPHDTLIGVRIGREHHFRAADPGEPALRRGGRLEAAQAEPRGLDLDRPAAIHNALCRGHDVPFISMRRTASRLIFPGDCAEPPRPGTNARAPPRGASARGTRCARFRVRGSAGLKPHRGGHRFASHRIRRGKNARFRDRRMLLQQTVDLGGLHVEAGTVDLVLDPAGEPNAPGTIDSAAIAGAVPAVL